MSYGLIYLFVTDYINHITYVTLQQYAENTDSLFSCANPMLLYQQERRLFVMDKETAAMFTAIRKSIQEAYNITKTLERLAISMTYP